MSGRAGGRGEGGREGEKEGGGKEGRREGGKRERGTDEWNERWTVGQRRESWRQIGWRGGRRIEKRRERHGQGRR